MFWNYLVSLNKNKKTSQPNWQGGFGLIELMVSISIMAIVAAIILIQQSSFNSAILLRSQAYEVALQLRDIQLSAVSASSNGSGAFKSVLGAYFNSDNTHDGQYSIFRDTDSDGFYVAGEAFGIQGILDKRFEIGEIRTMGAVTGTPSEISIVFTRPNFDARFFTGPGTEAHVSSVEIDIVRRGDVSGLKRTVEVTSTGQIAVK
jgi:prepilin-type N-terminal cleavage/methylation domain-containing protein